MPIPYSFTPEQIYTIYGPMVRKACERHSVPLDIVFGQIEIESLGCDRACAAVEGSDAYGVMQVRQAALTDYNGVHNTSWTLADLFWNPDLCVEVGTWYIGWCIKRFPDDIYSALRAYNVGYGTVRRGADCSAGATYANKVQNKAANYRTMMLKNPN